ncbi:MAG TPA: hypothetical protein VM869_07025 [Enhygromyxa sp.]|nr:hypothetical protein [Enhygromyxa sp.]
MGNGVTVIFGTVRTTRSPSEASVFSGPPGGAWAPACSATRPRRRGRARPSETPPVSKPAFDETTKGRNFKRRVRTFVG